MRDRSSPVSLSPPGILSRHMPPVKGGAAGAEACGSAPQAPLRGGNGLAQRLPATTVRLWQLLPPGRLFWQGSPPPRAACMAEIASPAWLDAIDAHLCIQLRVWVSRIDSSQARISDPTTDRKGVQSARRRSSSSSCACRDAEDVLSRQGISTALNQLRAPCKAAELYCHRHLLKKTSRQAHAGVSAQQSKRKGGGGGALAAGWKVQREHGAPRKRIGGMAQAQVPQGPHALRAVALQVRCPRRRLELQQTRPGGTSATATAAHVAC